MSQEVRHQRPYHGFPVFAVILIAVGIVLLLQTLGLLSWALWGHIWRFWPIIIITTGLNIIFGRRAPWLVAIITILLIALAFGLSAWQVGPGTSRELISGQFSRPLEDIKSAELDFKFGAGELTIGSLPQDSADLVAGETKGPEGAGLSIDLERQGDRASLKMSFPKGEWHQIAGGPPFNWQANLSPRIPLELRLESGASTCHLDLSELKVSDLNLKVGASSLEATMPKAAGQTNVDISAGAATITINIPQGVAAKIKHKGFSSLDINESRFPKSGDYYMSPNYDTAVNRVWIDLSTGATTIRVK